MADILFLSQRLPYPPDKGDKIRSWRIFEHFSKRHSVHLGTFIDDPEDLDHVPLIEAAAASACIARLDPRLGKLRALPAFLSGRSLSEPYFYDRSLATWTKRMIATVKPTLIFVFSSTMGQYIQRGVADAARLVVDFVDVDSDKWRQYAARTRGPMRHVYAREAERLLAFDRALSLRADASVFVSEPEAALFRRLVPEAADKIHAIANGIDTAHFDPGADVTPAPREGRPQLLFTGRMDYWPNVDAAQWLAETILPLVRERHADARLVIAGAKPAPEVVRLAERPGVTVTGAVPDMRAYFKAADVVVAPVRIARGIQNKVLEGLAMAKPVVTTPQGLEGIDARPGDHLLVGDTPHALLRCIEEALAPERARALGQAGRALMISSYGWSGKLDAIDAVCEL